MTRTPHPSRSSTPPVGLALVLVGLVAVVVSRALDGFPGGLLAGLGLALLLIGVYTLSASRWSAQHPDRGRRGWLPSRDSSRGSSRDSSRDSRR